MQHGDAGQSRTHCSLRERRSLTPAHQLLLCRAAEGTRSERQSALFPRDSRCLSFLTWVQRSHFNRVKRKLREANVPNNLIYEWGQCPRTPLKLCAWMILRNVGPVTPPQRGFLRGELGVSDGVDVLREMCSSSHILILTRDQHLFWVYDPLNLFWEMGSYPSASCWMAVQILWSPWKWNFSK